MRYTCVCVYKVNCRTFCDQNNLSLSCTEWTDLSTYIMRLEFLNKLILRTLPDTDPRTCTRLGSSGGVNVGAGWCSSVRYFWYCYRTASGNQIGFYICFVFILIFFFRVKDNAFLCEAQKL